MLGVSKGLLLFFVASMLGINYLDYLTGIEIGIWALYIIPIALASWMAGFQVGALLAMVSTLLMFFTGLLFGHAYSSTGYFLLALGNRALAFFAVAWLASRFYKKQMLESTLHSYEEYMDALHGSPETPVTGGLSLPPDDAATDADRASVNPDRGPYAHPDRS